MSPSSCTTAHDAPPAVQAEHMQRSRGQVHIGVRGRALQTLAQSGCLRACFPRPHDGATEAVIVNTAGGIADGDRLRIEAAAEDGADLVVTTPSAERVYRARPQADAARVNVVLRVKAGARLAFLPQETILFDGCALDRTLEVALDTKGSYLGVEALVFGRQASGETVGSIRLRDAFRLRRDGRLVLHDCVRLQGSVSNLLASHAGAGGGRGMATLVYAACDVDARLDDVRRAISEAGSASAWDGVLMARMRAADGKQLRDAIAAVLSVLHCRSLPRVWA